MPRFGAYTLSDETEPKVIIRCDHCNRRGVYATARLLERFGPDIAMPDLLARIVREGDCPRLKIVNQACQAKFENPIGMRK